MSNSVGGWGGGGGLSYQKGLISPLSLVLGVRNEKKSFYEIMACDYLHMSNLTSDPCFRSFGVIILKGSYISLIIGSRASKSDTNLLEIMGCESFASVKFDMIPASKSSRVIMLKRGLYSPNNWF